MAIGPSISPIFIWDEPLVMFSNGCRGIKSKIVIYYKLQVHILITSEIVKNQDFLITISFIEVNLEALILTYAT